MFMNNSLPKIDENIMAQLPMKMTGMQSIELLSKVTATPVDKLMGIFSTPNDMQVTKELLEHWMTQIALRKTNKLLRGIELIALTTDKSSDEILQLLSISKEELLESREMKETKNFLLAAKNVHQEFAVLQRDIGRFIFEHKYCRITGICVMPYLSEKEKKEYLTYRDHHAQQI